MIRQWVREYDVDIWDVCLVIVAVLLFFVWMVIMIGGDSAGCSISITDTPPTTEVPVE